MSGRATLKDAAWICHSHLRPGPGGIVVKLATGPHVLEAPTWVKIKNRGNIVNVAATH